MVTNHESLISLTVHCVKKSSSNNSKTCEHKPEAQRQERCMNRWCQI